ncbi:hypothetical protein AMK33_38410 [Streptomyces sp. CB02400]|nr:hypothetical protein AMK33_38410 [Streptomyces sp. CB02400]
MAAALHTVHADLHEGGDQVHRTVRFTKPAARPGHWLVHFCSQITDAESGLLCQSVELVSEMLQGSLASTLRRGAVVVHARSFSFP